MLFSYWEYIGGEYDGDIEEIGRDDVTKEWWKLTDERGLPHRLMPVSRR
jgi:L-rhamnose mutarotase